MGVPAVLCHAESKGRKGVPLYQPKGARALSENEEAGRAESGAVVGSSEIWGDKTSERGLVRKGQLSRIKGLPETWGSTLWESTVLSWDVISSSSVGQQQSEGVRMLGLPSEGVEGVNQLRVLMTVAVTLSFGGHRLWEIKIRSVVGLERREVA